MQVATDYNVQFHEDSKFQVFSTTKRSGNIVPESSNIVVLPTATYNRKTDSYSDSVGQRKLTNGSKRTRRQNKVE